MIDPNVKGGLRWPLGKSSCANRYRVCGVWHTIATTYQNPTLRLQIREADRYDFRTGIGGTSREVYLKLKALSKLLKVTFVSFSIMLLEMYSNGQEVTIVLFIISGGRGGKEMCFRHA